MTLAHVPNTFFSINVLRLSTSVCHFGPDLASY
jgi:hypothetical protein